MNSLANSPFKVLMGTKNPVVIYHLLGTKKSPKCCSEEQDAVKYCFKGLIKHFIEIGSHLCSIVKTLNLKYDSQKKKLFLSHNFIFTYPFSWQTPIYLTRLYWEFLCAIFCFRALGHYRGWWKMVKEGFWVSHSDMR